MSQCIAVLDKPLPTLAKIIQTVAADHIDTDGDMVTIQAGGGAIITVKASFCLVHPTVDDYLALFDTDSPTFQDWRTPAAE